MPRKEERQKADPDDLARCTAFGIAPTQRPVNSKIACHAVLPLTSSGELGAQGRCDASLPEGCGL